MKIIFEEPDNGIHISSVKIIWNDDNLLPVTIAYTYIQKTMVYFMIVE